MMMATWYSTTIYEYRAFGSLWGRLLVIFLFYTLFYVYVGDDDYGMAMTIEIDRWMDGWMDERMVRWMDGWIDRLKK